MATLTTIIVDPSDTEAGSFNIFQFIYDINGDPQVDPFLLESDVPTSSLVFPGHPVLIDDFAYGIRLVSNDNRGFGCVTTPIDHFFSNVQIENTFTVSEGDISITGVTFGSTILSPLPDLNSSTFISLSTGSTVQDTTTVGIFNNDSGNTLSYQITIRDSDNILPFTYSDTISPVNGAEVSITGTTISPDRQFRLLVESFVQPSPSSTPSLTLTPTPSQTLAPSPTRTPTVTPTVTTSPGLSPSVTPSLSLSRSLPPSGTPSRTAQPSVTPTVTVSESPGTSPMATPTVSLTPTGTPSQTPSRTVTRSVTPTISVSPSFTPTKTPTRSITPTPSPPVLSTVMITNTNGAFAISNVTINGQPVFGLSIPFPIQPGVQSVGSTDQRNASYTVIVSLNNTSTGEHIQVNSTCTSTNLDNFLTFTAINTLGTVVITYGAGLC